MKLLQQTNTAPRLQLILSSVAKQLPFNSTEKEQHIPHQQEREEGHTTSAQQPPSQQEREEGHTTSAQQPPSQQEREGHTTSAQQPPSMKLDVNISKTNGGQSTKVQSPPCAIVLSQPVSRPVLKADLKIATLNSNKAQHSNTTSLASNRFIAPPVRIHGQPNPKTVALSSMQRRPQGGPISHWRPTPLPTKAPATQPNPKTVALSSTQRRSQGGPISHCRPTPLPTKAPATQPNPKTVALSSTQRRSQGGPISHCRPTPLPTKAPATQPNPKTVALSSAQRRPQSGPISHCRPTPLPTKTPATQSSSMKGLAHQCTTLSAQSLSAIHKASTSSSSLQAKRFLSGTHSSKVTAK